MWLTIWSIASSEKLIVISSTTGRSPVIAAPTPTPTIVFSEIGVSRTRFSPKSSSSPWVTLKAPLNTPTSSPSTSTRSSRSSSSRSAWLSASRYRSSGNVEVVVDRLGRGELRGLGELDGLVDPPRRGLVELGHGVLGELELGGVGGDRVALAPVLDLLLLPVLLGVGHRVPGEPVGHGLDEQRHALGPDLLDRLVQHLVGVDDVHPVAAQPAHAEPLAALVQIGLRAVALQRRPHPELVVGDHEDDR